MASESPTQMAREAKHAVDILKLDVELLKERFDSLSLLELRERVAVLEERVGKIEKALEELKQFPVLANRIGQLEDQKKLGDTRLFQFILLFVGGVITLSVQIVLLFFKK